MQEEKYIATVVNEKLVLLTYARLQRNQFEPSLFIYDMGSSDDGFNPLFIQKQVIVNHYGTLLSSVPLLNKNMKCLIVNEESFTELDTYLSIDSYLEMTEVDKDLLIYSQLNKKEQVLL